MEKLNLVYLSIGTNQGDKVKNIKSALEQINLIGRIDAVSKCYECDAIGFESNNKFLNLCTSVYTKLTAEDFLDKTKTIEQNIGREKSGERNLCYIDRIIDIDLIFFNHEIIYNSNLIIPHPEYTKRKFVLVPLLDIVTNLNDPRTNESIANINLKCEDNSILVETNFCFDSKLTH